MWLPPRLPGESLVDFRKRVEVAGWATVGPEPEAPPHPRPLAEDLKRDDTATTVRQQLTVLRGGHTDVRLEVLRPASHWRRLTQRNSIVRVRDKDRGGVIEYFVIDEVLGGYLLTGNSQYRQAVITPDRRIWFLSPSEDHPQTYRVRLHNDRTLPTLDQETLDRLVVRLGSVLKASEIGSTSGSNIPAFPIRIPSKPATSFLKVFRYVALAVALLAALFVLIVAIAKFPAN